MLNVVYSPQMSSQNGVMSQPHHSTEWSGVTDDVTAVMSAGIERTRHLDHHKHHQDTNTISRTMYFSDDFLLFVCGPSAPASGVPGPRAEG